jgi:DNA-binding transcriptional MerR regulator
LGEVKYTSGQIAASTGLTIRTVQYYDKIGLLPSSGRTKNGRRYYTQDDLIRLEQIVLYKALGFSLEQIKKSIVPNPNRNEILDLFENQKLMLLQQIEHIHTALTIVGRMADRIEAGKDPMIQVLLRYLNSLPSDDIFSQVPRIMAREQYESLSRNFKEIESSQEFFHSWKEVFIDAAILAQEGVVPDSNSAQELAERWYNAILTLTNGESDIIEELSELHLEKYLSIRDKEMFEAANDYLGRALNIFMKNKTTLV